MFINLIILFSITAIMIISYSKKHNKIIDNIYNKDLSNFSLYEISNHYFQIYEEKIKNKWKNNSICLLISLYNSTQGYILSAINNYNLFWPTNIGKKVILLDKGDEYLEPYIIGNWEVHYEEYNVYKNMRKQYSTYISYKYCLPNKYIAFMDSDSIFTMKIAKYMLFDAFNKPYFLYTYKIRYNAWNPLKMLKLKKKKWGDAMISFPVIVYTKHIISLNKYLIKLHGVSIDKIINDINYYTSQYNVILEYVKKFYPNDYHFLVYEEKPFLRCGIHVPYAYNITTIKEIKMTKNLINFIALINRITYDGICSIFIDLYPQKCKQFNFDEFFGRFYVIDQFPVILPKNYEKDILCYKRFKNNITKMK